MAFGPGYKSIDRELTNTIEDISLLSFYLGIHILPCVINSPLREDKNPSFGLTINPNGKVHYKDFATGEKGGIYDLLMKLLSLSFPEVLERISEDFSTLNKLTKVYKSSHTGRKQVLPSGTTLDCKVREWKSYDLEYWEMYGISLPWLNFGEVYPISHIIATKEGNIYTIPAEKYGYVYIERKDGRISKKIYQPFSKIYKWSNTHDSSVWDLWRQLPPFGENLIITSSRKDALCIWENSKIPSCSLQAESLLPKEHVVQELKNRFKNVYVLYDNDFNSLTGTNIGQLLGENFSKRYQVIQLNLPQEYQAKDTSDLAKLHGRLAVKEVILKLITKR